VTSAKRLYAYRLRGTGKPVKWGGECLPELINAIRESRLVGGTERVLAATVAAVRMFSKMNGWTFDSLTVGPNGEQHFQTPAGPAMVLHEPFPLDLTEYTGAAVDALPASWLAPGQLHAYVIRLTAY
jgi:hypothetical protein